MQVVRKILFPQMMGLQWPRPGMAVLHLTFAGDHLEGVGAPSAIPSALAPRNAGQLASFGAPVFESVFARDSDKKEIAAIPIAEWKIVRDFMEIPPSGVMYVISGGPHIPVYLLLRRICITLEPNVTQA